MTNNKILTGTNINDVPETNSGLKESDEKKEQSEKMPDIEAKISGCARIDVSKINGNRINDIFELAYDPEKLKNTLFCDKNPVKIALESFVALPSNKLIFRFYLWFGYTKAPVIEDMPRGMINDPVKWIRKRFMDYPRMSESVIQYITKVSLKVLPLIEKTEVTIHEEDLAEEVLSRMVKAVKDKEIPDDPTGAINFKTVEMKNENGVLADYACICGSETFKELLREICSPFSKKEFLRLLDNWEDGSLLKKDSGRNDYKFNSKDSKRWYCIKIQENAKKLGE